MTAPTYCMLEGGPVGTHVQDPGGYRPVYVAGVETICIPKLLPGHCAVYRYSGETRQATNPDVPTYAIYVWEGFRIRDHEPAIKLGATINTTMVVRPIDQPARRVDNHPTNDS